MASDDSEVTDPSGLLVGRSEVRSDKQLESIYFQRCTRDATGTLISLMNKGRFIVQLKMHHIEFLVKLNSVVSYSDYVAFGKVRFMIKRCL